MLKCATGDNGVIELNEKYLSIIVNSIKQLVHVKQIRTNSV